MELLGSAVYARVNPGRSVGRQNRGILKLETVLLMIVMLLPLWIMPFSASATLQSQINDGPELLNDSMRPSVSILAGPQTPRGDDTELLSHQHMGPPRIRPLPLVFQDTELGPCRVATNIPQSLLQAAGIDFSINDTNHKGIARPVPTLESLIPRIRSLSLQGTDNPDHQVSTKSGPMIYVLAVVPGVWTRGESLSIKFELYNDDLETHVTTLSFTGYDKGFTYFSQVTDVEEFHVEKTVRVRRFTYGVQYLHVMIPQYTPVGLKRGVASAGGDANYHKDFGYSFVQKFGPADLSVLPPPDQWGRYAARTPTTGRASPLMD